MADYKKYPSAPEGVVCSTSVFRKLSSFRLVNEITKTRQLFFQKQPGIRAGRKYGVPSVRPTKKGVLVYG